MLDLAFDAIFVRRFHDRTITYWNRGAEELYGYTREEAVGKIPFNVLKTRYPMPLEEIEWELLATGRWQGELIHESKSGDQLIVSGRWVLRRDPNGEPTEILEINSDVTRRVEAERSLRGSEERFRLLVASVRDYAIFMLDPRGFISSWNEGARRIKGYTPDEITGRHFSVFYPREEVIAGKPQRVLQEARTTGGYQEEGWRVRKDGTKFWAEVALTPLYDDSGTLTGFAKVTRDLSTRRRQEDNLRDHAQRIAELEAAKSNFLNLASHELRGPLTVLRGYLAMFGDGTLGELSESGKEVIPILTGKVDEMAALVEQMLEVARLEEGKLNLKLGALDVRDLVKRSVEQIRLLPYTTTAHKIDIQAPRRPVLVEVDPSRFDTMLSNLLSNAVKYSPEGGTITVRIEPAGERVHIVVEDEGLGIEPDHMDRLFTRFGRIVTPETGNIPGTGLGLYLTRELALLHSGEVSVKSTPGAGSVFTLTLPTAPS